MSASARCVITQGVPSPVKHPEYVDMIIFRENTEDIYTGIEFQYGTEDNKKFKELFKEAFPKEYAKMRFPDTAGLVSSLSLWKAQNVSSAPRSNGLCRINARA